MISGHIIERYPKNAQCLYIKLLSISLLAMAFSVSNQTLLIIIFCIAYTVLVFRLV